MQIRQKDFLPTELKSVFEEKNFSGCKDYESFSLIKN